MIYEYGDTVACECVRVPSHLSHLSLDVLWEMEYVKTTNSMTVSYTATYSTPEETCLLSNIIFFLSKQVEIFAYLYDNDNNWVIYYAILTKHMITYEIRKSRSLVTWSNDDDDDVM